MQEELSKSLGIVYKYAHNRGDQIILDWWGRNYPPIPPYWPALLLCSYKQIWAWILSVVEVCPADLLLWFISTIRNILDIVRLGQLSQQGGYNFARVVNGVLGKLTLIYTGWGSEQSSFNNSHHPLSENCYFSTTEHPVDLSPVCKLEFVHCGPVEKNYETYYRSARVQVWTIDYIKQFSRSILV